MALDFKRPAGMGQTAVSPQTKAEVAVVEKYDIVEDRERLSKELANSQELDDVVSTIQVYELESIVTFGAEAADEVSKASDVVLNSMNMDQLNDSGQMLTTLTKIMDKFDIDEIREDPGTIRWVTRSIRFMSSSSSTSRRLSSRTGSLRRCLRSMWTIITSW